MPSNNIKALKSGVWYTVSSFLTKGIGVITIPLFTRLMSKDDFGTYNNYVSWAAVFKILVTLNLGSTFISARYDYEEEFDGYICSMLCLSTVSVLVWSLCLNMFSSWFSSFLMLDLKYINCMMVYLAFLPVIDMFQICERYLFRYKVSSALSMVITIGTTVLSVVFVMRMQDKLAGRIFGSCIPTVVVGLLLSVQLTKPWRRARVIHWRYALPLSLPYIPHLLSLSLLHSTDKLMIMKICGPTDTALYSLAYSCGAIISILINAINSAYAPWLGEQLHSQRYNEIRKITNIYACLFFFAVAGILLVAPEILFVLGGKSYMEAMYVLPPVIVGCVCQFMYILFVNVEQFEKHTVPMAFASVSAAILNYLLNFVFIPRFGYGAAAYTTFASYAYLLFVHMAVVYKIGFGTLYDTKVVLIGLLAFTLLALVMNILYKYNSIRFVFIGGYVSCIIGLLVRYRAMARKMLYILIQDKE